MILGVHSGLTCEVLSYDLMDNRETKLLSYLHYLKRFRHLLIAGSHSLT